MNEMENYLYNHAYVSNVKTCNRQFELSKERAECIANKYNSLVEQKDKEIERLNNIIDGLEKFFVELNLEKLTSFDDYMLGEYSAYKNVFKKLKELKEGKEFLNILNGGDE